jgi:membrane protein required for colicin V production
LSKVDIILAIIILVGAYSGFRDGFRVELFSLVAVFLGVLLGFKLMGVTMVYLEEEFFIDEYALPYIAFSGVFFLVLFLVNLVARALIKKYPEPILGLVDSFAGAIFGFLRTTFMLSLVLWILHSLKLEFPPEWIGESWVFPMVADFAPDTLKGVGNVIPWFSDVIH